MKADRALFLLFGLLAVFLGASRLMPSAQTQQPMALTPVKNGSAAQPTQPAAPTPIFREVAEEVGLKFRHFNGATGEFYLPEIMGPGVALIDYDNDGDLDVYLTQGTSLDPTKKLNDARFPPPPGWKPGNRLFRNMLSETGKLQFVDVTEKAGVGHIGYAMGVAVGDYDNDGYPDLYVTNYGHNVLYHNNRDGTFTDVTRQAGVDMVGWSTSAAFVDYDGDGYLDLFVANYVNFTIKENRHCYAPTGELDYCHPSAYRPATSRLFRNLGNGKFQDVTQASGIGSAAGPALGVVCADFNGDGWVDIFVANDGAANHLWQNQGNGTFREVGLTSGAAYDANGRAHAGMGIALGDIDNSGVEHLLVTNLTGEGDVLYLNNGKGFFLEASLERGLFQPTYPFTGFGTGWLDYDNDGFLDLFITNGLVHLVQPIRGNANPYNQINQLFHNEGPGQKFREVTKIAGSAFRRAEVGRGAAFGDINNDGGVDIVVTNNDGPVRLLLNEVSSRAHWLEVALRATKRNRFGLGARVGVFRAGEKPLWRRVHTDSSYLSASDSRIHFGLGQKSQLEKVVVVWPDGSREMWDHVQADRIITLRQGTGVDTGRSPGGLGQFP